MSLILCYTYNNKVYERDYVLNNKDNKEQFVVVRRDDWISPEEYLRIDRESPDVKYENENTPSS
jgi:hypothetical protein